VRGEAPALVPTTAAAISPQRTRAPATRRMLTAFGLRGRAARGGESFADQATVTVIGVVARELPARSTATA
jgi:hypothetical protein